MNTQDINPRGRPQVSQSTENRIVRFWLRGWSFARIAWRVGVSTSTVWQVIHRQPSARRREDPKLHERINRWGVWDTVSPSGALPQNSASARLR